MADVHAKAGGSTDAGFFVIQIMYTLGAGVGVLLGPPGIKLVGFEVCCMGLGAFLLLCAFLAHSMSDLSDGG